MEVLDDQLSSPISRGDLQVHTVFPPILSTQHRWIQFSHFSASIVECAPLSPRTHLSPSLWANLVLHST